jgi:ketosteroid isomerase-like protein
MRCFLGPLLLTAGQLAAQTSTAPEVRRSIDAGNAAYIAAFAKADPAALAAVYDPLGARFNEGGLVVRGRDHQGRAALRERSGGKYVTVWRRQPAGDWKILADMGVPGT